MTFEQINERSRKRFSLTAKKAKVNSCKEKLASEDYKVIKCAEAIISAYVAEHPEAEMPYDAVELIANRKATRDTINLVEAEIEELNKELNIEEAKEE